MLFFIALVFCLVQSQQPPTLPQQFTADITGTVQAMGQNYAVVGNMALDTSLRGLLCMTRLKKSKLTKFSYSCLR